MKTLNNFIIEKFELNKNTKKTISSDVNIFYFFGKVQLNQFLESIYLFKAAYHVEDIIFSLDQQLTGNTIFCSITDIDNNILKVENSYNEIINKDVFNKFLNKLNMKDTSDLVFQNIVNKVFFKPYKWLYIWYNKDKNAIQLHVSCMDMDKIEKYKSKDIYFSTK